MLHGLGGSHADALAGMSPAQGLALKAGGRPLAPMAMVTVDGGDGYWNPHPGDNPMAMVIDELSWTSGRAAMTAPSSPRRNHRRWRSSPGTSRASSVVSDRIGTRRPFRMMCAVLHPGFITGTRGFLAAAVSTRYDQSTATKG